LAYVLSLNFYQGIANYNLRYSYGEAGFKQAITYLKQNNVQENQIIGRYDIHYYLTNKKLWASEYSILLSTADVNKVNARLADRYIQYILVSKYDLLANPHNAEIEGIFRERHFYVFKLFGDFILYKKESLNV